MASSCRCRRVRDEPGRVACQKKSPMDRPISIKEPYSCAPAAAAGFVTSLGASLVEETADFQMLEIGLELTPKGLEDTDAIIEAGKLV